jgi:cobalt-zinc-cadmium efflux system outer membrane protein
LTHRVGARLFLLLAGTALAAFVRVKPLSAQRQSGPEQPLALQAALQRALANNPELRATRADTGLALAQLVGSRLRPNPALALEYLSNGDGRISLTQDLQLWGLRGARIRAASLEQERARSSALDAARVLRREVVTTYRDLLFQQERAALLDSLVQLNQRIVRASQLAFEQGFGSELDSRLSTATFQQSLIERDAVLREAELQQIQLAWLLGDSLTTRYRLTDSLPTDALGSVITQPRGEGPTQGVRYDPVPAGLDSLVQLALSRRPDILAAQFDAQAQEASVAAAQAAGKATVAIGAIYGRNLDDVGSATGPTTITDHGIGLGMVIGLPVRSRNQGEILRTQYASAAARLRLASVRLTVERDVRVAVGRLALASSRIETLRRVVLPASQGALRLAETAFGRGQLNIFQVLQVQRTYADATTALLDATREFAAALSDLEAALADPVP